MSSTPFDTLHLQPHASRDLIGDAHALLSARAERTGDVIRVASLRIVRDRALALASDDAAAPGDAGEHYHALAVAEDADAEIIALAYRVAIAGLPADATDGARDAIEEARATLTNTYRRARYDFELRATPAVTTAAAIAPNVPAMTIALVTPEPATPEAGVAPADRDQADVTAEAMPEQLPLAFDPPPAVAAHRAPRRGVLRRRVRNRPKKLSAPVDLYPHIAPVLPRLSDEGELIAELRFIEGPLAGATVPIAEGKLTLGSESDDDVRLAGGATASLRIWRLDGRYMLRRINGEARIDGVAMRLPAAQLEAGMVVDTGPHRAVFAFRRVPQAVLPMLSAAARADDLVSAR